MTSQTSDKSEISLRLVAELIRQQFPQWAHLQVRHIEISGWDNRTFHLGQEMLIRLPSAQGYAEQVPKEQKWLPILAPYLSVAIPKPIVMGKPSKNYPWNWSVYKWIEGENADTLSDNYLNQFALNLAQFLNEFHKIDPTGGPLPGDHNYWRGASPVFYDNETRPTISKLEDLIDVNAVTAVWQEAINSKWSKAPVWIHGDLSVGNILVKNNKLAAVIDFGCIGIGDPACDLVMAWTFLTKESRKIFRSNLSLDADTWARARGWALWKALITLASLEDKSCSEAIEQHKVINEILVDHDLERKS